MNDVGDWQRLGREVAQARLAAGYRDTAAWAEQVGRSTRVLLGLERGERQGRKTLEAVELALQWPAGRAHQILFGTPAAREELSAGPNLSVVPAIVEEVAEPIDEGNEVLAAIQRDPYLLPEAKAHFINQYQLLLRVQEVAAGPLPYAAHGRRTSPVDPAEEARIEAEARAAAERNPHSPIVKKPTKKPPTSGAE